MGEQDITPRVRAIIAEQIDSVMQLEVLLLLADNSAREWDPTEVAQQFRIDQEWVDSQLRGLTARGLVEIIPGPPVRFRYQPRTPELAQAVAELGQAYANRRVTVIGMIFSKPVDKIRSFADAFRLRKDKNDG